MKQTKLSNKIIDAINSLSLVFWAMLVFSVLQNFVHSPPPLTDKQVIEIEKFCQEHDYKITVNWDFWERKTNSVACISGHSEEEKHEH